MLRFLKVSIEFWLNPLLKGCKILILVQGYLRFVSRDSSWDVNYKSVAHSKLNFTFSIPDVSNSFDFINQLFICRLDSHRYSIQIALIYISGPLSLKDCLADRPVNPRILYIFHFKNGFSFCGQRIWRRRVGNSTQKGQVKHFVFVVLRLVPLNNNIFKFADSVQIAVDLLRTVNEKETSGPIFVIRQRWSLWGFYKRNWFPLEPLNKAIQICDSYRKFDRITLANKLYGSCVRFLVLNVLVNPYFSCWRISVLMIFFGTLYAVKLVIGKIYLIISKEFKFCGNCDRDTSLILLFDSWTLRYELTLENTINSEALIMTKAYRFGPSVAPLKENVFKVGRNKRILNSVAPIINRLCCYFPPLFWQSYRSNEKQGIKCDQSKGDTRCRLIEFDSSHSSLFIIVQNLKVI